MRHSRRRVLGIGAAVGLAASPWSGLAKSLGYPRLLQGPMLGASHSTQLTIWGRASGPLPVSVQYDTDPAFSAPRSTDPVLATSAQDYTFTVRVEGLEPNTVYWYRVLVDGVVDRYRTLPFATRTAPSAAADFSVGFGSCARIARDPDQRIFRVVDQHRPDMFLWLGDNIYADADSAFAIADEYRRQRNVPSLQSLLRSVPQLAIWDDHDFGYNNSDGTSPFKAESLETFRHYWPNPAFGLGDAPGVFFEHSYAGVDFFFLDGRYHRSPNGDPDGSGKTLLGARQKRWLKERLVASRAPFKILVCGSGWSMADGIAGDTWAAFRTERDELFDFIRDRDIRGVVCLSGDSHVGELNCIPWSERGGYDLYDLVSSPLAQSPSDSWVGQSPEIRMRSVYAGGANFGLLQFRKGSDPSLTFTLFNEWGEAAWKPFTLAASELRNGASTWRSKIDPKELARRDTAPR